MDQVQQIIKVYSGKSGCMCGCRGKWTYSKYGAEHSSPGYPPRVNERVVKMISEQVLNDPNRKVDGNAVFVECDGRIRAVYLG